VLPICNDRKAVLSMLDHFKPEALNPASQARLMRMRGHGEPNPGLAGSDQWKDAVATVAAALATPPLVLTEGQS